jgi:hypothetical protein
MLTKSHTAACSLHHPLDRDAYRLHMCGLCHALGDNYGLPHRLLASHEMIVLNLLTSAQRADAPGVVMRRCPLNPLLKVATNQDSGSQFAAAAAVELAAVSVDDDIQDSRGRDLPSRIFGKLLDAPERTALNSLDSLGFDTSNLTRLNDQQTVVENEPINTALINPAQPSAESSASLFTMTARLANRPENEAPLGRIGAYYGTFVYLLDAYRDFAADMANGDFNPLRVYAAYADDGVRLSRMGLDWLTGQFEQALMGIRAELPNVYFFRYRDTVTRLLCEPVERIITELAGQREQDRLYRQWHWLDALKAAFFVLPAPALETGVGGIAFPSDDFDFDEKPKRDKPKRGSKRKARASKPESSSPVDCGLDACYVCSYGDCRTCDSRDAEGCSGCGRLDCNPCDGDGCSSCDCNPST